MIMLIQPNSRPSGSVAPVACTAPAGPSKQTHSQQEVARLVADEAIRQGVDPNFALAIAEQESRFRQSARSPVGATGVMQLMPGTAAGLGVNPYDLRDNIRGGVKYIKQLQGMFGNRYDLIAAGYNAGPYRQSLQNGRIRIFPRRRTMSKRSRPITAGTRPRMATARRRRPMIPRSKPSAPAKDAASS